MPVPIQTAPSIKPDPADVARAKAQAAVARQNARTGGSSTAQEREVTTGAKDEETFGWILPPDKHPWPLHFREAAPVSSLFLNLPSAQEAKLLLPGRAADAMENARRESGRYLSGALSEATASRTRQMDAVETWIERTLDQRATLGADPWMVYQFALEARANILPVREKITQQTPPVLMQLATEVRTAIAKINPIMPAMPTHELQLGWYNVMVLLRDGLAQYQSQVMAADQALLDKVDGFLAQVPAVPRPEGQAPSREKMQVDAARAAQAAKPVATEIASEVPAPRKPASEPVSIQEPSSASGLATAMLTVAFLALVGWVVLRVKGRRKAKAPFVRIPPT